MPDSFSLVWGHSVHVAKFPILPFLTFCLYQFSSDLSKLYTRYPKQGAIQAISFWGRSAKNLKKNYGILNFLFIFTQDHMQLEMSKVLFLPQFSFFNILLYRTICSWKCRKCYSPTIFVLQHSIVLGLQFKQIVILLWMLDSKSAYNVESVICIQQYNTIQMGITKVFPIFRCTCKK